MTKHSPKVIANARNPLILALNNPDRVNKSQKEIKKIKKYLLQSSEYYSDPTKSVIGAIDYMTRDMYQDRDKENIVFSYDAKSKKVIYATSEEKEKRKKDMTKWIENSNFYQVVCSFQNDWVNENIKLEDFEYEVAKNIIPSFLKHMGFEPQNIAYQFSFHHDTDNLHFHLSFMEKKPAFKSKISKELRYRRKGKIEQEDLNFLKKQIQLRVENAKNQAPMLKNIDKELSEIKKLFSDKDKNLILSNVKNFSLEEKFVRLGKLLTEERNKKGKTSKKIDFGSIRDEEIINLTKEIKKEMFDKHIGFSRVKFNKALDVYRDYIKQLNLDNNISDSKNDFKLADKKVNELEQIILNKIANEALFNFNYKNFLSMNKNQQSLIFIQDLIYQNYQTTFVKNKKDIIKKYQKEKKMSEKINQPFIAKNAFYNIKKVQYQLDQILNRASEDAHKSFEMINENIYDKTHWT